MAAPMIPDSSRLRLTVTLVVVLSLFLALFARLWFLQVINAPTAQLAVRDQGVKLIYRQAPRGEILDRNGNVLVGNRSTEVIEVSDRLTALDDTAMLTQLGALLGMTVTELKRAINNTTLSPPYAPAIVLSDATAAQILYIQEHQDLFPGVSAITESVRDYSTMGVAAANLVGYVGQITAAEYSQLKSQGYQAGDQIGQAGVEAEYNSVLAGTPGVQRVEVNSRGAILSVLQTTAPVPGRNIKLTIDGTIQVAAVNALAEGLAYARTTVDTFGTKTRFTAPAASAVVLDPQDGSVLALATDPDYDPNQFLGGISSAHYAALKDPAAHDPLLDRSIQGEYAPGSTFKLVTATAGLQQGLITPQTVYHDVGRILLGGQTFTNDNGESLGDISLSTAITRSSDNYFNYIGIQQWNDRRVIGEEAEQNVAHEYGFGSQSGIKLPFERAGLIATPAIQVAEHQQHPGAFPNPAWTTGESAQIAIGQDQIAVTPLQLANAYATFANGGTLFQPRLAIDSETPTGTVVDTFPAVKKGSVTLQPDWRAAMLAGFRGVVQDPHGTGYGIFAQSPLSTMDLAGKTGTAQVSGTQSNSVFTSFAPASNPQYEVTAIMERSGYGANIAGPVVRQIYDQIYNLPRQAIGAAAAPPTPGAPGSPGAKR